MSSIFLSEDQDIAYDLGVSSPWIAAENLDFQMHITFNGFSEINSNTTYNPNPDLGTSFDCSFQTADVDSLTGVAYAGELVTGELNDSTFIADFTFDLYSQSLPDTFRLTNGHIWFRHD